MTHARLELYFRMISIPHLGTTLPFPSVTCQAYQDPSFNLVLPGREEDEEALAPESELALLAMIPHEVSQRRS